KLSQSGATSGSGLKLNLSNTGGLFTSATHTTSGQQDTYTFKTAPTPSASPTPGQQQILSQDEVASIFVVTFAITVPHVITSAPGALFTLDRKTAIWKLTWTKAQTLTATTGSDAGLVASVSPAQDSRLVIAVGFIAIAVGFLLGMLMAWRGLRRPLGQPVAETGPVAPASLEPPVITAPGAWPGPPRDTSTIRLGQMVTCNSYRPPSLLAKMASCIDVMSHGRLILGIGAGWYQHEYEAYGYEYPETPERLRMLREALQVIKAMWTEDEASFDGRYYHLRGASNEPKP